MTESRLTDVNTACISYRTKCLMALDKRLYKNCIGAIKALNGLLPEDNLTTGKTYRIIFDDEEYNKVINSVFQIKCPECNTEYQYDTIDFVVVNLPTSEQIMSGRKTTKVWFCTKCKKNQRLDESDVIEDSKQMPFYSRFVPMPPVNDHGLISQLSFHSKMVEWIWLCLDNLEEAFARFRDDNWSRGEKMFDGTDIDTSFEEGRL